jgi:hypothetical protein
VQKIIRGIQTAFANLLEFIVKRLPVFLARLSHNQNVGVFTFVDSTIQGGGFVVGEFLIIRELSSIGHWTNLISSILFCSSFILSLSIFKFLLWVSNKPIRLKWEDKFIQRLSTSLGNPKASLMKN